MNNTISIFFKRGDLGKVKDLEILDIVDYSEQVPNFIISERMQEIFLEVQINADTAGKSEALRMIKESNDESVSKKWIIKKSKLSVGFKQLLYQNNGKKATSNIMSKIQVDTVAEAMEMMIFTDVFEPVDDVNAWVGGNVTVGSGGDYATWTLLGADEGSFTSDGKAVQVSILNSVEKSTFAGVGAFTRTLDGGGFLSNFTDTLDFLSLRAATDGCVYIIENFNVLFTNPTTGSFVRFVLFNSSSTQIVKNNSVDGGGFSTYGIRSSDSDCEMYVYNNVLCNGLYGIVIDANDGNVNSILEYNTIINNTNGIECNDNDGKLQNNACYDNATDYLNTSSLTTFLNNKSSDATGNLTPGVFETDLTADFIPKITGSLYDTNTPALIAENTISANGAPRNAIGANGVIIDTNKTVRDYLNQLIEKNKFSELSFFNLLLSLLPRGPIWNIQYKSTLEVEEYEDTIPGSGNEEYEDTIPGSGNEEYEDTIPSEAPKTSIFASLLFVFADELKLFQDRYTQLINESVPGNSIEMLPDWLKLVGLPEKGAPLLPTDLVTLQNIAHQKYTQGKTDPELEEITQSRDFYISYASGLGYTIEIGYIAAPFTVNENGIGDSISEMNSDFVWTVSGDYDDYLKWVFEKRKQSFTKIYWI